MNSETGLKRGGKSSPFFVSPENRVTGACFGKTYSYAQKKLRYTQSAVRQLQISLPEYRRKTFCGKKRYETGKIFRLSKRFDGS